MGIIRATIDATRGTLADQYKEFVTSKEMGSNVLVRKGVVLNTSDSSNMGRDNVLTDGTGIIVNEGQCMLIVANGKVVDFCNVPGTFIYRNDLAPSMLTGGWEGLKKTFGTIKDRVQTGGQAFNDQRVYYVNTKELMSNKFGVGQVPFRDSEFNFTMKISAFGEYSYRITDPLLFYTNVTGHVDRDYTRDNIDSQFKSEVQASLQPALGRVALQKVSYDQLPLFTKEIGKELNNELTDEWVNRRGLSVVSFAIASVTPDAESAKKIEEFQSTRVYTDASMLGARIGTAQANAMETAAGNEAGAMTGFMGMGFAQQQSGTTSAADLLAMGKKNNQSVEREVKEEKQGWTCQCGETNTGKFCGECGGKRPESNEWTCACGNVNTGKFCGDCGGKRPESNEWTCECGEVNEGKFCGECGNKQK